MTRPEFFNDYDGGGVEPPRRALTDQAPDEFLDALFEHPGLLLGGCAFKHYTLNTGESLSCRVMNAAVAASDYIHMETVPHNSAVAFYVTRIAPGYFDFNVICHQDVDKVPAVRYFLVKGSDGEAQ